MARVTKSAGERTTKQTKAKETVVEPDKPTVTLPKGWVNVMSKGYLVDPFEGTEFPESVVTPTKLTSWVEVQLEAGILIEVKG